MRKPRTTLRFCIPILLAYSGLYGQVFDIVLSNGRVIDPESGLDAIRNVGIRGKSIAAISAGPLRGRTEMDVHGLVVAPGFIDLHSHGQDDENYHYKAHDRVTTALELEIGVSPVAEWYQSREGKALVNVEFDSPPSDPFDQGAATDIGRKQDAAIKSAAPR